MHGSLLGLLTVLAAGLPSCVAAYYGHRNSAQLRTGNNKTVGEMVTEVHGADSIQSTAYNTHGREEETLPDG